MRLVFRLMAIAALAFAAGSTLAAEPYPTRPITIMVPYPPGGLSDAVARLITEPLSKELGQPVLVENLGGASGAIGVQKVLSAPADGYYIFQGSPNELILAPLAIPSVKFKSEDFSMVQTIGNVPLMVITRKDLQANSIDELVKLARSAPKNAPLTFGSVGPGSLYHVLGEHMAKTIGATMTHVPYKGGAPLTQDLSAGHLDFAILPLSQQQAGLADIGKIKILGTLMPKRVDAMPNVPSVSEGQQMRRFNYSIWTGYFVKKGTPDHIAKRLNAALAKVLQEPKVRGLLHVQNVLWSRAQDTTELAKFYDFEVSVFKTMFSTIKISPQ